ncbi:hypothetical protein E2C01_077839 [Portunus trituberculatus]|uniref:Uncharacterized protein n=1 Tax=Portunus trituberculatus TaxID=210409 RepID=A0A5B7ISJ2_PORTR|nr:hypothetical protein [Portunus trituberculatus]
MSSPDEPINHKNTRLPDTTDPTVELPNKRVKYLHSLDISQPDGITNTPSSTNGGSLRRGVTRAAGGRRTG